MATFEIPFVASAQKLGVTMGGTQYTAVAKWNVRAACWVLDLYDVNSVPFLTGIPLVTGADLFGQFEYLEIGGALIVQTDHDTDAVPTYENLGTSGHAFFVAS